MVASLREAGCKAKRHAAFGERFYHRPARYSKGGVAAALCHRTPRNRTLRLAFVANRIGDEYAAPMSDVTQLLSALGESGSAARDQLLDAIYRELRAVAGNMMARESPGHTLRPTALVHEAWLRLGSDSCGCSCTEG